MRELVPRTAPRLPATPRMRPLRITAREGQTDIPTTVRNPGKNRSKKVRGTAERNQITHRSLSERTRGSDGRIGASPHRGTLPSLQSNRRRKPGRRARSSRMRATSRTSEARSIRHHRFAHGPTLTPRVHRCSRRDRDFSTRTSSSVNLALARFDALSLDLAAPHALSACAGEAITDRLSNRARTTKSHAAAAALKRARVASSRAHPRWVVAAPTAPTVDAVYLINCRRPFPHVP